MDIQSRLKKYLLATPHILIKIQIPIKAASEIVVGPLNSRNVSNPTILFHILWPSQQMFELSLEKAA